MEKGLVSAICVNWNGEKYIGRLIDSLISQSYSLIEIIIVDNQSSDSSVRIIKEKYPGVAVIENNFNSGWPAGLNTGIRASRGEYVVALNNDIWLDRDCVKEMVRGVNKDDSYGSCACKIFLDKNKEFIEVAGVGIYMDGLSYGRGRLKLKDKYAKEEEVFCASDCCCLYKKAMLDDIGLYDERFFLYAEETEMGWRHQLAGWRCFYAPTAVAFHEHSASVGEYSPFKAFHVERNRIWVALRYYPLIDLIFKVPFFSMVRYSYQLYLGINNKGSLSRFRQEHSLLEGVLILMKAHWSALLGVRGCLIRRINTARRISPAQVRMIFKKYSCSTAEVAAYE